MIIWVEHVARVETAINTYGVSVSTTQGKKSFERPGIDGRMTDVQSRTHCNFPLSACTCVGKED